MIGAYESTDPNKDPTSQLGKAQMQVAQEHPLVAAGMAVGGLVLAAGAEVVAAVGGVATIATTTASPAGTGPMLGAPPAKTPDFVVTPEGVPMRPTAAGNRTSLEGAGLPGKPTTQTGETGTIHTVPGKDGPMDVRIMDGGSGGPPRVITSRPGTNDPVRPDGSRFPNGTPKQVRRDGSHTDLQ